MTESRSPELAEIIEGAILANRRDLRVAIPAEVVSYDVEKQAAKLKVMIKDALVVGEEPVSVAELTGVPVSFGGGGGFFLSFPLAKGDKGLVVFCDRAIGKYLGSEGIEVDPVSVRTHDFSDGYFIPGGQAYARAYKDASETRVVLGKDDGGMQLTVDSDVLEAVLRDHPAVSVAIADHLETLWGDALTGLVGWLTAHTHSTGMGPSGPPPAMPAIPSWDPKINSDKLLIPDNTGGP